MSTIDSVITSDLTALGEDSRRHLVGLDDALRRTNMYRDEKPGAEARRDALADERRRELVMMPLTLSHVFAHRIGRAAAGCVALLCALTAILMIADPLLARFIAWFVPGLNLGTLVMLVAVKILAVYVVATWIAEAWFARRMHHAIGTGHDAFADLDQLARGPVEIAHHAVRRVDGISMSLFLGGMTSMTLVFGYIGSILGATHELPYAWSLSAVLPNGMLGRNLGLLVLVVAGANAVAIGLGRACQRTRPSVLLALLGHWAAVPIAFALGIGAAYGGFHILVRFAGNGALPTTDLRIATAVVASAAVVIATAWALLWWRRREQARIGD